MRKIPGSHLTTINTHTRLLSFIKNTVVYRRLKSKKKLILRLGVDTGGTFTDFIAFVHDRRFAFKIPSTPSRPADAILAGVERIFDDLAKTSSQSPSTHIEIAHGTTVATNALLEGKGARTALVTTAGFEDVLEIGRQARPDLYNLNVERRPPLVPSSRRFGIDERVGSDGGIIRPLDDTELESLIGKVARSRAQSIAVSLLFAFANPEHEKRIASSLASLGVPVSLSHEILPEYREYERTSTVVINAYLVPVVGRYLAALEEGLNSGSQLSRKITSLESARVRIMQSSGGSISATVAAREPVRTILSGPAGGVVAALRLGALTKVEDLMTFDMGGTSTDVALCRGTAATTGEATLAGLPVAVPVIDIHTVGAGGGSIARVDEGGSLRVGPQSAGADPGPACYGKGDKPTVTDANLLLGRFGGVGLLAGEMKLDVGRARKAFESLAKVLSKASGRSFSIQEAALGVVRVANLNMEQALRLVSIERGHDPRRFSLVSFGGAGGLHATALAKALRIQQVIVPMEPGNFSALGVLLADVSKDYSQTVMITLGENRGWSVAIAKDLAKRFAVLESKALEELKAEGFQSRNVLLNRSLAMRYRGQSFELDVSWGRDPLDKFDEMHKERYGHSDRSRDVEIVTVRLKAIGVTEKPVVPRRSIRKTARARTDHQWKAFSGTKFITVPVYEREILEPGERIASPAIIVEYGSTTWLEEGWSAAVDEWNNLRLTMFSAKRR